MRRLRRWVICLTLGALLALGAAAVPTASGHRSAAAKRGEARHDAHISRKAAVDARKDLADQNREARLSGMSPAMSEPTEEAADEESESTDAEEETAEEQEEISETEKEDELEEQEEVEEGTTD